MHINRYFRDTQSADCLLGKPKYLSTDSVDKPMFWKDIPKHRVTTTAADGPQCLRKHELTGDAKEAAGSGGRGKAVGGDGVTWASAFTGGGPKT